jgi:hypothetical protein
MLRRAREARNPRNESVVVAVCAAGVVLAEQLVQSVIRLLTAALGHLHADSAQPRSRHRNHQPGLALAAGGEITQPSVNQLMPRQAVIELLHARILDGLTVPTSLDGP